MRPTLQTVADAVGVSRSTVSNAFGRPDQLSPELRERVLRVAEDLGYPGPDPAARSLRSGKANAIGVLFTATMSDAFTDPYAVQFLRGVAQTVERYGNGLLLIPLSEHDRGAALRALGSAVVDGFCVFCVPDRHSAIAAIRARGLPVVTAEGPLDGEPDAMFVGIDEYAAAYSAAAHVARLGHRRAAVISIDLDPSGAPAPAGVPASGGAPDPSGTRDAVRPVALPGPEAVGFRISRERLRGIRDAFAEVGVGWNDLVVIDAGSNLRERGEAAAAHALDRLDRCTAVLTYSDVLALGVVDALAARGLRAGSDVSVAGFDDIPEADAVGLTTVRQPALRRGALVAELLLDPPADPAASRVLLPTELVVRSSTGPVERT